MPTKKAKPTRVSIEQPVEISLKERNNLPTIISVLAVLISLAALGITAWDAGLFSPFDLVIYADTYFLPHTAKEITIGNSSERDSFVIGVPIIFQNEGDREAVIEDVALHVKNIETDEIHYFSPLLELDPKKFIQGQRIIHAENILSTLFVPFVLDEKQTVSKTVIFYQPDDNKYYPYKPAMTGNYTISIFVKTSESDKYKQYNNNTIDINEDILQKFNAGTSSQIGRIGYGPNTFLK